MISLSFCLLLCMSSGYLKKCVNLFSKILKRNCCVWFIKLWLNVKILVIIRRFWSQGMPQTSEFLDVFFDS